MYYEYARKIVAEELIDAKRFTVGNEYTEIQTNSNYLNNLSPVDIEKIIRQFELDGKLKIISASKVLNSYDVYVLEIPDISYFESLILPKNEDIVFEQSESDQLISLTLSLKDTLLILNDTFIVTTTKFGFENYEIIKYLLENPNRLVTKKELIEKADLKSITKSFSKIVENLKFKGDLRKAFFKVKKDGIMLFNPVSKDRLDELGLKYINLFGDKE